MAELISLPLAQELKEAGLVWPADLYDFFAIPDRDMDDRVFVVSDVMTQLELLRGWPVVTFHGVAEWALDFILTKEVVWMPTESQLRRTLEEMLMEEENWVVQLTLQPPGYECAIFFQGKRQTFHGETAATTYARALLHVLKTREAATP
jgi:hypothetical protein